MLLCAEWFTAEAHLQCGEDYLVHRGKVRVPQHLGPLSEGQDSLISYCSHCGWHLRTKELKKITEKTLLVFKASRVSYK